jgi:hypothetical protein
MFLTPSPVGPSSRYDFSQTNDDNGWFSSQHAGTCIAKEVETSLQRRHIQLHFNILPVLVYLIRRRQLKPVEWKHSIPDAEPSTSWEKGKRIWMEIRELVQKPKRCPEPAYFIRWTNKFSVSVRVFTSGVSARKLWVSWNKTVPNRSRWGRRRANAQDAMITIA